MCSIAGAISRKSKDVVNNVAQMLTLMKHRGPDYAEICTNKDSGIAENPMDLTYLEGSIAIGHTHLSINEEKPSVITDCEGRFFIYDGNIYNLDLLKKRVESHKLKTELEHEAIIHLFEENASRGMIESMKLCMREIDGSYAMAIMDDGRIIIARDPIGIKPVYIGMNEELIAFASERKALWKIGIRDVKPLDPGYMAILTKSSIAKVEGLILQEPPISKISMKEAIDEIKKALIRAFFKQCRRLKKVALAFSGGIDSFLMAKILSEIGIEATLYTVGLEGSHDIEMAEKASSELEFDHKAITLTLDDICQDVPSVIYAIEEPDVMKASIGIPLHIASKVAKEDGMRLMMIGQGPDELFAGYARYIRIAKDMGYDALKQSLWIDLIKCHEVNFERDDAVMMANSIQPMLPYLDFDFVNLAMKIPPQLKVDIERNQGKWVFREVAIELGISPEYSYLPKKAMQFGSGSYKALNRICKMMGFHSIREYLESVWRDVFSWLQK